MADKKISALTAATTPLAGTEVLPIVQGGSTVKVSAADLTVGRDVVAKTSSVQSGTTGGAFLNLSNTSFAASRYWKGQNDVSAYGDYGLYQSTDNTGASYTARLYFDAAGNPTVSTGNLVIGTAGKGIDFSAATHAAGMTSELLNYYAEGTGTATRSGFTEVLNGGTITSTYYYTRVGRTVFMNITLVCAGGASISWGGSGTAVFTGLPFTAPVYAVGQWLNTTNLATTGPTAWISTAMYVAGPAATITTNNSFSFSGTFNV